MKALKKDFLLLIFVLFLILVVSNAFAYKFFLYWRWWWLDVIMHTLGGLWLGFVMLWLLKISGGITLKGKSTTLFILIIVSFASFGGVLWELFEYSIKGIFHLTPNSGQRFLEQVSTRDTISDLFFDTVGGFTAALFTFFRNKVD